MVNGIVFGKPFPVTLCFQGRSLRTGCFIVVLSQVDPHICELGLMLDVYLVVIPEPRLCFEARLNERREVMFARGFLAVNIGGQPDPWLHVHAPTVKMEIGVVVRLVRIRAVEPDDVEIVVLDPNAAYKRSLVRFFSGLYIDDDASNFSQEFLPYKGEVVIILLEV